MELFYNPERMTEREIKETFVAHQWLVDEIISILKRQPDGPGVQHVVIVAPRGMGKTTMLLMLRFTVMADEIGRQWQPVLFPEESYFVNELADLWLAVLNHVATETRDSELQGEVSILTTDTSHLEENALARIKNWRTQNGKRLMLLIDNFDMILGQIGDERDNARLRDVLMNDETLMLVGGATTFFKEARAYDQPLYNLFKIYNLNSLDPSQIRDLLRRRAEIDGLENFDETLRKNEGRIRVLEYFTGGNPRLVLMLYRIITHSEISEVRRGLEKLLDEVTPYYKAKIETLPAQQRKILDQIARSTSRTREGMTPTEIATQTRLPVNQVSSQLKRLSEAGYVHTANLRGRSTFYTLSEPLYAIWHQMRFGRDARKRMNWLVTFLKDWYDAKELGTECERLREIFRSYMSAGRQDEARNALEHRRYLVEAIEDSNARLTTFESIIVSYLELSDVDTLKSDVLTEVDITSLSEATQQLLVKAGLATDQRVVLRVGSKSREDAETSKAAVILQLARAALETGRQDEARERLEAVLKLDSANVEAIVFLAILLAKDGKTDESNLLLSDLAKRFPQESPPSLMVHSFKFLLENRLEESLDRLDLALEAMPKAKEVWQMRAVALKLASRPKEALESLAHIAHHDHGFEGWRLRGGILTDLGRKEEALTAFNEALVLKPNAVKILRQKTVLLIALGRKVEALSTIDYMLSIKSDSARDWIRRGLLMRENGTFHEAVKSFERAIELDPSSDDSFFFKAITLYESGRKDEALQCVDRMLEQDPNFADAYFLRANFLVSTDPEKAKVSVRRGFSLTNSSHPYMADPSAYLALNISLAVEDNDLAKIKSLWKELTAIQEGSSPDDWQENAFIALRAVALAGHWTLAKNLIISSQLEDKFFPLARALDYLLIKDKAVIEKLSPEVRRIVIEIVETLAPQELEIRKQKKRAKKSRVSKKS